MIYTYYGSFYEKLKLLLLFETSIFLPLYIFQTKKRNLRQESQRAIKTILYLVTNTVFRRK